MNTSETTPVAPVQQAYFITAAEAAGMKAFEDGIGLAVGLKELDFGTVNHPHIGIADTYRHFIDGWEKASMRKHAQVNPHFAQRQTELSFEYGRMLTVSLKVVDPERTPQLMASMYSKNTPVYIAGCEVHRIGFAEAEQHEKLRKQLYDLVNEHGIIASNGR